MKIQSTDFASQGPFVVINDEDFNPDTMTLYDDPDAPGMTKAALLAALIDLGQPAKAAMPKAELQAMYDEATKATK